MFAVINCLISVLSASGDTELVMKAISHGARDFLQKPVRLEELRNIWQHVIRNTESQFVWSLELHHKFLEAVNQLGVDSMFFTLSATLKQFVYPINFLELYRILFLILHYQSIFECLVHVYFQSEV